ncbi:MAG: calcium-binding protein, partial [Sphingomicrobium sp.]
GDNLLIGGAGGDQLDGGTGVDTADYSASKTAVSVSLTGAPATGGDAAGDALTNIERLVGSVYNDQLGGDGFANSFVGGAGADTIDGGGGSDTADYATSAQGVAVNLATNVNTGGDAAGDTLNAIENVSGSAFADQLTGNAAVNWLVGGGGDDMLDGGAGVDTLDGGLGNDIYYADAPGDIVIEAANAGSDSVVTTAASFVLSANVEALTYVGSGNFTGTGTDGNEKFSSGVGDDTLYGLGGDDLFLSSLGADQYVGGAGRNTASYTQSLSAVTVNLATNVNLGGSAQGDLLFDIQIVSLSNYADDATGSDAGETFFGRSGVDIVRGMGGDDWLDGGAAADTLYGGLGNDNYVVDDANDQVIENADEGIDTVTTARASWTLSANVENLVADSQSGFAGTGNSLGNQITGTIAADVLNGMDGDDTLIGGLGGDQLIGGNGADTASYAASVFAVAIDLGAGTATGGEAQGDTLSSIENLIGSARGDTLTGSSGDNRLDVQAGNDQLKGGAGNDILIGGAGNDGIDGGDGADTAVMTGLRSDYLVQTQSDGSVIVTDLRSGAPDGADQLTNVEAIAFADMTLTLSGGGGPPGVTILGTAGNDLISTTSAPAGQPKATINNDIIYGLGGADTLDGGGGADALYGGSGNDIFVVDNVFDRAVEDSSPGIDDGGTDLVKSSVSFALGAFVENLTLTATTAIDGTGNALVNKLIGNTAANVLHGGAGNDTLQGVAGNDSLYGDAGNDTLDGGSGADTLFGGAGDDTYLIDNAGDVVSEQVAPGVDAGGVDIVKSSVTATLGQFFENLTLTGSAAIDGSGNDLANKLVGNTGSNALHGGNGNDTIGGGAGNDVLWGEAGLDTLTGGTGADTFMLFAPVAGNQDKVVDFTRTQGDKIGLVGSDFGLSAGALDASHLSTTGVVTSAAGVGQLVYNPSTKVLMWDADGSGGAAGITLATFGSGVTLTASDFIVT